METIKEVENGTLHVMTCELSNKYEDTTNIIVEEDLTQLGEHGEEKVTNQVGLDSYRLHVELRAKCKRYLKMSIIAGGRQLNTGETAAVLAGGTITVNRRLAKAGEERKSINGKVTGTYENDRYIIADIISVSIPDEDAMFSDAEIAKIIRDNNALEKVSKAANPFGF